MTPQRHDDERSVFSAVENMAYWNREFDFNLTFIFHTACVAGGSLPLVQVGHRASEAPCGDGCRAPDFWCDSLTNLTRHIVASYPGGVDSVVVGVDGSWKTRLDFKPKWDVGALQPLEDALKDHVRAVRASVC